MEWTVTEQTTAAGCPFEISAGFVGEDILICLQGGERPHLGCVVQTEPRKSLTGDGTISATSSVLNYLGHKDEALCRRIAEKISSSLNRKVICTGGFHKEAITPEEIQQLQTTLETITEQITRKLKCQHCPK